MTFADSPPDPAVLDAFSLASVPLERATSGLINPTWFVRARDGTELVLQRLNPIFPAEVNLDIEAVTSHLFAKGIATPTLVTSRYGKLWFEHDGVVWRALTRIDGVTRDALESPAQAREAGRVLAEFHRALNDLEHDFRSRRLGVHDTARHLKSLRDALDEHRGHGDFAAVRPLAEQVLALAAELPALPSMPDRIVHGDPKISNVMFAARGDRALCLIDLDTLARMPVALELGDALRSWCNPATEDAADARFVRPFYAAAVEGYAAAARGLLAREEWGAIADGTLWVTVELAARFCADALRERYFRWDERRYASASAHNQARTRAQLAIAERLRTELPALRELTARATRPASRFRIRRDTGVTKPGAAGRTLGGR
jgi:Ser/Thr protein kinase RdoA (MazF antagonist)